MYFEITSHHKTHVAISSAFSQYPPVRLSFRPLLPPPVREPRDWVCSTDRIGRRPASAPLSSSATMVLDRSKRAAKYNGVKPYNVVSSSTRAPAAISFFTAPTCPALAAMCSALAPALTPLHGEIIGSEGREGNREKELSTYTYGGHERRDASHLTSSRKYSLTSSAYGARRRLPR